MDFLANFGPRYIQHHCEKCHSTIMTLVLNESCSNTNILGIYRCLKDFSMGDKSINPLVALYFLKILVTSTGVVKIPWEPFASLPGQILFWPHCPHTVGAVWPKLILLSPNDISFKHLALYIPKILVFEQFSF